MHDLTSKIVKMVEKITNSLLFSCSQGIRRERLGATSRAITLVNLIENVLTPQQQQGVSVRIADQQSRPIILERHGSGRDEEDARCCKPVLQGWQVVDLEGEAR